MRVFLCCLCLLLPLSVLANDIRLSDDLGRDVTLPGPAQRIVALAPHLVENAYSAGAGERLVAAVDHADYPPPARQLPSLGSARAVSVEAVLAREPDLVLLWGSGNSERLRRQLERLDVPVYVDEPRQLEDVARSIRAIGELAGTQTAAREAVADYRTRLERLRKRHEEREPVSVFYQVWHQPLQTLNGEHLVSDVIDLCGGRNIYADAGPLAPKINRETLLERDPQVILASGADGEPMPPGLKQWRDWPALSAVRHENLFTVPADWLQRHTERILDGAERVCAHLQTARERLVTD